MAKETVAMTPPKWERVESGRGPPPAPEGYYYKEVRRCSCCGTMACLICCPIGNCILYTLFWSLYLFLECMGNLLTCFSSSARKWNLCLFLIINEVIFSRTVFWNDASSMVETDSGLQNQILKYCYSVMISVGLRNARFKTTLDLKTFHQSFGKHPWFLNDCFLSSTCIRKFLNCMSTRQCLSVLWTYSKAWSCPWVLKWKA